MKTETLEALLIDRALGALSPEVAELLENYLIQNPDAAQKANGLESTVQLARTVAASPVMSMGALPPLGRVRKALAVQRRHAFLWEFGKLAACVLVGLAIGLASRFGGRPDGALDTSVALVGSVAVNDAAKAEEDRNGFWSLANLASEKSSQAAAGVRLESRYRLRWDSPVKMPHLEGNL
jgi:hypothetical protein